MREARLYDGSTARLVGSFSSVAAALSAADGRAVAAVEAAGDWVLADHYVVCVDDAHLTVISELTHLGPPGDPDGCREWLRSLPGRET